MSTPGRAGGVNPLQLIGRVFTLVGAALLAGALYQAWTTQRFIDRAVELKGEVVDLVASRSRDNRGHTYSPRVRYRGPDGQEHLISTPFSSNPPAYDVGEAVAVLQDPSGEREPALRGFASLWLAAAILGGIGSVFFVLGLLFTLGMRRSARADEQLRERGRPIQALIQGVERNRVLRINGQHPFVVVCRWRDPQTMQVHLFRSENLPFDPTPHLDREQLRVFIAPDNPARYLVDLSFLPRTAA